MILFFFFLNQSSLFPNSVCSNLFFIIFSYVYMSGGWLCARECRCLQKSEEGGESPVSGLKSSCEPPDISAGNQTPALCKSNACS